ncbi:MAG: N(4)-(beta-N-acetylglucosaminyl)-L-asparaginase [Anaerolineales bacterium]|nr:N(4)-(beta-N-acetylglucosaminyl)-L-asparaginase [Anaerolineales bacterium]
MSDRAILIATHNGGPGFAPAMDILRAGGSALDAVEAATVAVEDNVADTSVGTGGLPNLLGQVELDALIMDGETLNVGAVGALQGYPNPIRVARQVMTRLPHDLLVGEGAARFAAECGFAQAELLTEESHRIWQARLASEGAYFDKMREMVQQMASDPWLAADRYNGGRSVTGTVNFVARDRAGRLAVAVSTSGWAWKYPGRVGDSALVGAGGYADSRYGAAACTGRGESAMRSASAHSVVLYIKMGLPLWNACRDAIHDLYHQVDDYASGLHIVALDAAGQHAGFTTRVGMRYLMQRTDMDDPAQLPMTAVDAQGKAELRPA